MKRRNALKIILMALGLGLFSATVPAFCPVGICAEAVTQNYGLTFDESAGVAKTMNYEGREVKFIAYENLVYVKNPASTERQSLGIYIPAEYYTDGTINGYTAKTAPIFLPNGVGGYMPGKILAPVEKDNFTKKPNASLVALSRGLVVVAPAIRGRTTVENNVYVGKAPALIVDYKAAVRYLRHNKNLLPAGDTEKIISNGTSAGGALSALLGSTGNAPEFKPYLQEVGAADERDDIYASSDYCPITNLENADAAYEWIYHGVNDYYPAMWQIAGAGAKADDANNPVASQKAYAMTAEEVSVSKILHDAFPAYVNSLKLHDAKGRLLTLDRKGKGPFRDYIKKKYIESAQVALYEGKNLGDAGWLTIKNGKVTDADLSRYAAAVTREKAAPAFDKMDLSSAENDEFGTAANQPRHFDRLVWEKAGGEMADAALIKIMNPLNFLGRKDADVARHFRIRAGAVDRDTALAIPAILALKLQEHGSEVNFFSPWGVGHAGDYDLAELFDWIDSICK